MVDDIDKDNERDTVHVNDGNENEEDENRSENDNNNNFKTSNIWELSNVELGAKNSFSEVNLSLTNVQHLW